MKNQKDRPFFSVIVPVYNAQKYLEKCIRSILDQTFVNFEVILVDDGSNDRSYAICEQYALYDERVKVFHKENGGPLQARIYGAEQAAGEYILHCDADDFYAGKKCFQLLYEEAKQGSYDLIIFGHYRKFRHIRLKAVFPNKREEADQEEFYRNDYPALLCSFWKGSRCDMTVWSRLYRRELMEMLPASDTVKRVFMGDDLILNLYALQNCKKVLFLPTPLYVHQELIGGTKVYREREMEDLNAIKTEQFRFLKEQHRENETEIEKIAYGEVAGWFLVYVQKSLSILGEEKTREMVSSTLQYPMFVQAQRYYQEKSKANWCGASLLRNADAEEYIRAAKEGEARMDFKTRVREACRKILYMI